jgi:hypothetical protein
MVFLVTIVAAGLLLAQPPEGGGGRRGPRGEGRMDRERMRARMVERLKEQLGANDEEWKVMGPRLRKVMDLSRQADGPGRRGMFFRRGGRDGGRDRRPGRGPAERPAGAPERERTAVEKAAENLQKLLDSESAKAGDIKTGLTALREAREKAKQELAKAQQELKQILTVKQEATLVLRGILN